MDGVQKRYSQPYSKLTRGCYVDYRDVAEAAAIAMTGDRLDYGTFEVSAHGMFNRLELASLMSEALGETIEAGEPSFDAWASMVHIPEGPLRGGLKVMFGYYDAYGIAGGNALVLNAIIGREPCQATPGTAPLTT